MNKKKDQKLNIYNKIFIPVSIKIANENIEHSNIKIVNKNGQYDSIMDNYCQLEIVIASVHKKFIFEGYIYTGNLNIKNVDDTYLDDKISKVRKILTDEYNVKNIFIEKFIKNVNNNIFFSKTTTELAKKISEYQNKMNDLSSKNINILMKEFVSGDLKKMYEIIMLLMMGNDNNICSAVLLYNLMNDKKINGDTITGIIYQNLSFICQNKLKKKSIVIKNELTKIKKQSSEESLTLEKKLAIMINMPDNVKKFIIEKSSEMLNGENNTKIQMAINGLFQFPWKPINDSRFEKIKFSMMKSRKLLQLTAEKLNKNIYGHYQSKKILIELIGKWIQNPNSSGQVIGLVGPPGTGKTLFAQSISDALEIPFTKICLGGMNDSADLVGHSFTYTGAQYGMIVRQMIKANNWRCVMLFDEVDKVSKKNDTNEIYNILIHITDPITNTQFQDRFYSSTIDFNLSGVLMIFSYNDSSKIDPILLDRIKEIQIPPYTVNDKISIARDFVLKDISAGIGMDHKKININNDVIRYIIENYTLEAGARELKRKLEQILLKINIDRFYLRGPFKKYLMDEYFRINNKLFVEETANNIDDVQSYVQENKNNIESHLTKKFVNKIFNLELPHGIDIDIDLVHRYLDKPVITFDKIHTHDQVGVVNGLYATVLGIGGVIPIQIFKNVFLNTDENLKLKITGNQKQIMKESVICAFTAAINILNKDIKNKIVAKHNYGFHIHSPDGATPKDGPSAGSAFATAFVSILAGKKINRFVAMTGEIDLTGKISKIGGIDLKLTGAKKAGIKKIFIPRENQEDYLNFKNKNQDIFSSDFEVICVDHLIDIVSDPSVVIDVTEDFFDRPRS